MKLKELEILRRFIINAKTEKALEGLLKIIDSNDKKLYNQTILLYSDYNSISEKINLGLGDFSRERNRINLATLEIISSLETSIQENAIEKEGEETSINYVEKVAELEDKLDLILTLVEKINESELSKFLRSNLFALLTHQAKNRLISLSSLTEESHDFNYLINECFKILELEFSISIFTPLKNEIIEESKEVDKKELMSKLEGDQKLEFYEYIIGKRENLTIRQMSKLLSDNLNKKYNSKSKEYNYIFYYMLRNYVIIDRWQLEKDLDLFVEDKIDKKLSNILFARSDFERIRNIMLKILRNLQRKNNTLPSKD